MPDDGIDRGSLMEVCLVFNGPLEMSAGKMAGQAFQAHQRLYREAELDAELMVLMVAWEADGTRTICRVATTPAIFERVCAEVPGVVVRDEGFTEVEAGAATLLASRPFLHRDRPKVLDNKKVKLLMQPGGEG